MSKTWQEIKRRRARGDKMRPIWQIALLLPLAILYQGASWFVDKMDNI